ncbi:hypothetical protein D3C85_1919140 [compost metagenome]
MYVLFWKRLFLVLKSAWSVLVLSVRIRPLQPWAMRIVLSWTLLLAVSQLPRGLWRMTMPVTLFSTVLP